MIFWRRIVARYHNDSYALNYNSYFVSVRFYGVRTFLLVSYVLGRYRCLVNSEVSAHINNNIAHVSLGSRSFIRGLSIDG
jgi:hypothetical protein